MSQAPLEQQLGGTSRTEVSDILHEGWVDKESKWLGRWRPRWLVLFRDRHSRLPVLCTFKEARHAWEPFTVPTATERIILVGASCLAFADYEHDNVKAYVFRLEARSGDFFFSTTTAAESAAWARIISQSIAEAALRLGGVPPELQQQYNSQPPFGLQSPEAPSTSSSSVYATPRHMNGGAASSSGGGIAHDVSDAKPSSSSSSPNGGAAAAGSSRSHASQAAAGSSSSSNSATPSGGKARAISLDQQLGGGPEEEEDEDVWEVALPPGAPAAAQPPPSRKKSLSWEDKGGGGNGGSAASAELMFSPERAVAMAELAQAEEDARQAAMAVVNARVAQAEEDLSLLRRTATTNEASLSEQNKLLARQVQRLQATLEEVAIAELYEGLEEMETQEASMVDELDGAKAAAKEADESVSMQLGARLARRAISTAIASYEGPPLTSISRSASRDSSLHNAQGRADSPASNASFASASGVVTGELSDDEKEVNEISSDRAEIGREIIELEQALSTLRLKMHFARDQIAQLEADAGFLPSDRSSGRERVDSNASSGSQAQTETDDEAYVPFQG